MFYRQVSKDLKKLAVVLAFALGPMLFLGSSSRFLSPEYNTVDSATGFLIAGACAVVLAGMLNQRLCRQYGSLQAFFNS